MHRRETAYPVPAKVFLKVSPDSVMLFSQSVCVHRRRQTVHPVPAKVFLKVSPDMTMLLQQKLSNVNIASVIVHVLAPTLHCLVGTSPVIHPMTSVLCGKP